MVQNFKVKDMAKYYLKFLLLLIFVLVLFCLLVLLGPVNISVSDFLTLWGNDLYSSSIEYSIIWNLRIPKAITALLAGGSLAVSGLLMQTYLQNPLAGPYVLGIHSGASLSVAIWLMGLSYFPILQNSFFKEISTTGVAILGSIGTLFLLLAVGSKFRNKLFLIVFGLILGHLVSGLVQILVVWSNLEDMKTFFLWSLGSFQRVAGTKLIILSVVTSLTILISFLFSRSLNLILLGDQYAKSSGLSLKRFQLGIILMTGILAGTVTSFCGPIIFVGIIAPHLAKRFLKTDDHRILMPITLLTGAIIAMSGELMANIFSEAMVPLNSILGLLGTPIILFFLINKNSEALS